MLVQKLRQFCNIHRDPPCLIFAEQFGRGSPAGLVLAIDVAQRLSVTVPDDEQAAVSSTDHGAGSGGGARRFRAERNAKPLRLASAVLTNRCPIMKKVGDYLAIAAFALILFAAPHAAAFGLRIGPFHLGLGVPSLGHRHHHHLYMHGNTKDYRNTNDVARHEARRSPRQRNTKDHGNTNDVARLETNDVARRESEAALQERPVSLALLYPARRSEE